MKMNKSNLSDEILSKVNAGVPIIQLISYEWRRVKGFCVQVAEKSNKELFLWNNVEGLWKFDLDNSEESPENPDIRTPIEILEWFRKDSPEQSMLLIENLHTYFEGNRDMFGQLLGQLHTIAKMNEDNIPQDSKILILSQPVRSLPVELEKDVYVIDIPLPDIGLLKTIIKEVIADLKIPQDNCLEKYHDKLAEAARGLTTIEAKYVLREIAISKNRLTEDEITLIIKEKEQIIKKSGILEYFHPMENISDVGGMDQLKNWLKRRRAGFDPKAEDYGLTPPKGALLLGVQGCGKSLIAKAMASEWNLPLLRFDLGKVFGGIIGESENNIRRALETAQAIAPSILWIDEIEKGFSGVASSDRTDGGTTSRVFGTMLTWMQEKKDPVFVIATANNIEQLPPELLRKGRFDEIFFVDLPGPLSRNDIWKIHLKKRIGENRYSENKFDIKELSKISKGYSGAEIEEAINEGLYSSFNLDRELTMNDLKEAIKKTVPLSKVMSETINELRDWAKVRAQLASSEESEAIEGEKIPRLPSEKRSANLIIE